MEYLEPGEYEVELVLSLRAKVDEKNETTEQDVRHRCRSWGTTVNWEINKVE